MENAILSPGVVVEAGAIVRDAIIMNDTYIGPNTRVEQAILDKQVYLGAGAHIGADVVPSDCDPDQAPQGLTLVGKGARIPDNIRIGRNCTVQPGTSETDFQGEVVGGATVGPVSAEQGH